MGKKELFLLWKKKKSSADRWSMTWPNCSHKRRSLKSEDGFSVVEVGNAFSHACGILGLIDPGIHCWPLKTMWSLSSHLNAGRELNRRQMVFSPPCDNNWPNNQNAPGTQACPQHSSNSAPFLGLNVKFSLHGWYTHFWPYDFVSWVWHLLAWKKKTAAKKKDLPETEPTRLLSMKYPGYSGWSLFSNDKSMIRKYRGIILPPRQKGVYWQF